MKNSKNVQKYLTKIRYVNALPGQGKTHRANKYIAKQVKAKRKILIAVPSILLMKQIADELSNRYCVNSTMISHEIKLSSGSTFPVMAQLKDAIQKKEQVILVSHVTLTNIPEEIHKELAEYEYIIDEAFNPSTYQVFQLKRSLMPGGVLNSVAKLSPTDNTLVQSLSIVDEDLYREYMDSNHFDSYDSIDGIEKTKELLKEIHKSSREALVYKMENSKKGAHCVCIRFNAQVLKYARRVTVMSAEFRKTELYHLLKQNFTMVNVTKKQGLRNLNHRNKRLTVLPLIEGKVYSKTFDLTSRVCRKEDLDKAMRHYRRYGVHSRKYTHTFEQFTNLVIHADDRFSPTDTLRVSNLYNPSEVGQAISSKSHGINEYQDRTSIAIVASFNQKPYAAKMSRILYPKLNQYYENNVLTVVQGICRTAIRDYDAKSKVTALVSDDLMANQVKSTLNKLPKLGKHCLFDDYTFYTIDPTKNHKLPPDYHPSTHYLNGKPRKQRKTRQELRKQSRARAKVARRC